MQNWTKLGQTNVELDRKRRREQKWDRETRRNGQKWNRQTYNRTKTGQTNVVQYKRGQTNVERDESVTDKRSTGQTQERTNVGKDKRRERLTRKTKTQDGTNLCCDNTQNREKYRTRQESVLERRYKKAKSSCQQVGCLFAKTFEIWMLQAERCCRGNWPPPPPPY